MNASESNISASGEVNALYRTLTVTASTLDVLLGLPINSYILWLIVTGGTMASDFSVLNLAASEILVCLFAISHVVPLIVVPLPTEILKLLWFSSGLSFTARPMFQCCISVERYLAVVHPLVFLRLKPLRHRVACCSVVWLVVAGKSLAISLTVYGRKLLTLSYVFFLVVMSFCCLAVLRALKQPGPGDGERDRDGLSDQKRRAFRIILINLVFTVLTYLPVVVFMPTSIYLGLTAMATSSFIILVSGFVSPILYLYRVGKLACIPL